jgi:NDP-sugar pyrophosphorylase family protein
MQIVIPMTGRGSRFLAAGYRDPKPLIEVDGKPIIEHIIRQFPGADDFLFICANDHLASTPLRATLERVAPKGRIVGVEYEKRGPVWAVLQASAHIDDARPALVHYCDFSVVWDYRAFCEDLERRRPAGCIQAYTGFHPHLLGPNTYANMRHRDRWMLEIREKHVFTDNRFGEYSSTGAYYFESGALLKSTFREAVGRGLTTNGEFYASTPYNLLVEQGKPVWIHEVPFFKQWGTPEDLEEYQSWSSYFRSEIGWAPSGEYPGLQVLIPMVGAGVRFRAAGYSMPKPLVPVSGVPMVERSLASYPSSSRWVCVMRSEDAASPEILWAVRSRGRAVEVVAVDGMTEGQASTCLLGMPKLDTDAPLLVAPCDSAVVWDESRLRQITSDPSVDCVVWTFRNHAHANRNPSQYGWVRCDDDGWIHEVRCKAAFSDDVRRDPGIVGIFWFRKASHLRDAAEELIRQGRRINNEFYADSAIQVLLEQGRRARVFDVKRLVCFGVPPDVQTFEYWNRCFAAEDRRPETESP